MSAPSFKSIDDVYPRPAKRPQQAGSQNNSDKQTVPGSKSAGQQQQG